MYKLYDWYEGKLLVGVANSKSEIKRMARQFYYDTDGECDLEVMDTFRGYDKPVDWSLDLHFKRHQRNF